MKQFNDILDIARTLNTGEELCSRNHWAKVSRILNEQEKLAAVYDAKSVVESNFQKKRRIVLENAIKFVEAVKWRFDNEAIAPISTNEIGLQAAMGCERNKSPRKIIKSYIDNLVILKVLKLESDVYSYDRSISRLYSFNQLVYARLLDYASSRYQISPSQFNDSLSYHLSYLYGDGQDEDASEDAGFDESGIRIRKRMKMDVTGVSLKRIESVLNARYPQFLEGRRTADELNKTLPTEEKIKWRWNLELKQGRNGRRYLTKIGFRSSNIICSYKKHENENPCYRGKWRSEYLSGVYGDGYGHYDFNASIWRLSYNLLHDDVLPESTDGYELAYGDRFATRKDRDIFKKIAMRLYFGGINQLGVQVENRFKEISKELGENYDYDCDRARRIQDIMREQKLMAVENIGGFFDSEIFLHESCIYLNVYRDIVKSGIRCSQVYDSFYFKAGTDIDVNRLYEDNLRLYKSRFSDTFSYQTYDYLSYHLSYLYGKKKAGKAQKPDDSDIPDEPTVNPLVEKLEKMLDLAVKSGLMGLFTANRISEELRLGRTWTPKDQPTGFCYSRKAGELLKDFNDRMPEYRKALRIEE